MTLYDDLSEWWALLSAPEEYEEEAGIYSKLLDEACAEPIETLLELGIPYGQGFLFARPTPRFIEVPAVEHQIVNEVPGLIVD